MSKLRIVYTADFEAADCAEVILKDPTLDKGDYLKKLTAYGLEKNRGHIQWANIEDTPPPEAPQEVPKDPEPAPEPDKMLTTKPLRKKGPPVA